MLKKKITYEDYNGDTHTEAFYFHLSESELIKFEFSLKDGLQAELEKMIDEKDYNAVLHIFLNIVEMAYGVKAEDGKRFIKNEEQTLAFTQSPAFDVLFMELFTDETKMIKFIKALLPKNVQEEVEKEERKRALEGKQKQEVED